MTDSPEFQRPLAWSKPDFDILTYGTSSQSLSMLVLTCGLLQTPSSSQADTPSRSGSTSSRPPCTNSFYHTSRSPRTPRARRARSSAPSATACSRLRSHKSQTRVVHLGRACWRASRARRSRAGWRAPRGRARNSGASAITIIRMARRGAGALMTYVSPLALWRVSYVQAGAARWSEVRLRTDEPVVRAMFSRRAGVD
jgi:hypothetical protein